MTLDSGWFWVEWLTFINPASSKIKFELWLIGLFQTSDKSMEILFFTGFISRQSSA